MKFTSHKDTFARDNLPPEDQWPEFLFDLPELQYPERLNCAQVLLDDAVAEGHGDRVAIYSESGNWTYHQLLEETNRIAHVLVDDLGLQPGNRVLLRSANNPMLAASWLAVLKAGGIAVTTMSMLRAKEIAVIAQIAKINHVLCDFRLTDECNGAAESSGLLENVRTFGDGGDLAAATACKPAHFDNVETSREDVALLAFTSGTTGQPKATMHFHRDVLAMSDVVGPHLCQTCEDDIYLGSPPLGFTFGLGVSLVFPLRFRAATTLIESPTAEALLEGIEKVQATALFTAPTMYRVLLQYLGNHDLTSLKQYFSAGETLPKATSDAWYEATGIRIIDGIGATEMIHIFIGARGDDIRPGATGKPLPGYQACILDQNNRPLPNGSTGRLAVKGPTGCRYMNDERQKEYVVDGWNVTGDVYRLDEDGYFWFEARGDDMILSAGYNIAGPEVEATLLRHEAVAECAAVAAPDLKRGNIVKAYIVLAEGTKGSDELVALLQNYVKQSIAPYKYPRAIEFVTELPKTQTGKIQRFKLRELASADAQRTV